MTLKIELEQKHDRGGVVVWKRSVPFVYSIRGHLVHRARWAHTHIRDGKQMHSSVGCWCGQLMHQVKFVSEPPEGMIVSERCEAAAVANGQPTSDELVGRHVHKGRIRSEKTCCVDQN